ncbi:ATP-grasp domain-containing protein [Candidatus Bathyarchaeota archaeon]|nr:ATP-grasp domain-containing protein [Candidatus Bathyarchaeota archaeon]
MGFNARPVVCLAKQLGFKVVAVDYWGDLDIVDCADSLYTVLKQELESEYADFDRPCSELLVDLAEKAAEQQGKPDFILVGSGLDDRPDLWLRLSRIAPVLGNTPEKLKVIRDLSYLSEVARKLEIKVPETEKAASKTEAVKIAKRIGLPVVIKPIRGSGGFRIRPGRTLKEVSENFEHVAAAYGEAYIQRYVEGVDASVSVLGDGRNCVAVTVNEQLIGRRELGVQTPFGYCGNIVPLKADAELIDHLKNVFSEFGRKLGLVGSNGFDFILSRSGEIYLMEVNPRFQATIECIKYVTGLNLVKAHIDACEGRLPGKIPPARGYAVKMIVFAREKGVVPDLRGFDCVFDVSHPGVKVEKGSPVCTVQVFSKDRAEALRLATEKVLEIHRLMQAQPPP